MIKTKCAYCKEEIINPRINQVTCRGKCSKAYWKALIELRNRYRKEFEELKNEI